MITATQVKELSKKTGAGLIACRNALVRSGGDELLAIGILKYNGCAVHVKANNGMSDAEAYDRWVMHSAKRFADEQRNRQNEII